MNDKMNIEVERVGKTHHYNVSNNGRFVGHIGRALIGVWSVGFADGSGGSFASKEECIAACTKRAVELAS